MKIRWFNFIKTKAGINAVSIQLISIFYFKIWHFIRCRQDFSIIVVVVVDDDDNDYDDDDAVRLKLTALLNWINMQ